MKTEFEILHEKIEELANKDREKIKFLKQHNFMKEASFYIERRKMLCEINSEIRMVIHGHQKPEEINIVFD